MDRARPHDVGGAQRQDPPVRRSRAGRASVGLVALQPEVGDAFVLSYTDNTNVLAAMRSMGSSSRRMQELLARRTAWMLRRRVVEASARITTDNNVWADWGSRGRLAELVAAARRMGLRARRVAMPPDWRDTAALRALLPDSLE